MVAVAIAGLLYVFAADFRSRAAVAVARLENVTKLAQTEANAAKAAVEAKLLETEARLDEARRELRESKSEANVAGAESNGSATSLVTQR